MNKKRTRSRSSSPARSEQVIISLVRLANAVNRRFEEALEEVGLSLAKFGALKHLAQAGEPLSLSECAARMTCVRSNITQLVDRLEADGLVRRVEDPADRRAVRATVTPLGLERQAAGARQVEKVQKELAKKFSGIDYGTLERMLSAIK
ncbi:MAG TPA: MarR family transcriptional regulator [Burkholderiales bacterium]